MSGGYPLSVRAVFADGSLAEAPTWTALEDVLRSWQWNAKLPQGFRREMQTRARSWSGSEVRKDVDSQTFLMKLEAAGLLRLEWEGEAE